MIRRQRLLLKNVQRRSTHLTRLNRLEQHRLSHQPAPRTVDNLHSLATQLQPLLAQNSFRLIRHRQMHRNKIHLRQQILHPIDQLYLQTPRFPSRQIRIIRHHPHPKSDRPSRHLTPDSSHPQNSQRLPIQLRSLKTLSVPLPCRHRTVRLGQVPSQPQQQCKRLLRRADRIPGRSIHHHHTLLRRRIHIHIVHTYPRPTHRPNSGTPL